MLWDDSTVLARLPGSLVGYFMDDDVRDGEGVDRVDDPSVTARAVKLKQRLYSA